MQYTGCVESISTLSRPERLRDDWKVNTFRRWPFVLSVNFLAGWTDDWLGLNLEQVLPSRFYERINNGTSPLSLYTVLTRGYRDGFSDPKLINISFFVSRPLCTFEKMMILSFVFPLTNPEYECTRSIIIFLTFTITVRQLIKRGHFCYDWPTAYSSNANLSRFVCEKTSNADLLFLRPLKISTSQLQKHDACIWEWGSWRSPTGSSPKSSKTWTFI